LLNTLLQDALTHSHTEGGEVAASCSLPSTDAFVRDLCALLALRIRSKDSSIRQHMLSWIMLLQSCPWIELDEMVPPLLSGALAALAHPHKDLGQQALICLNNLWNVLANRSFHTYERNNLVGLCEHTKRFCGLETL
jgi:hypothetical protein